MTGSMCMLILEEEEVSSIGMVLYCIVLGSWDVVVGDFEVVR